MKKVFVVGHNGMVGSAIFRKLKQKKHIELITAEKNKLNLIDQNQVKRFFNRNKIDEVYFCAAKVGGINANNIYPADFIFENLQMELNVINSSFKAGIKKLLFLGTSCAYPKYADQPIKEDQLLKGYLEKTNEPYALAKLSGLKMCESYNRQFEKKYSIDYRSVMPTNIYGPGDNYNLENSHVVPALIRKMHEAKEKNLKQVKVWGTGKAKREFLFVEDLADACIFIMNLSKKKFYGLKKQNLHHINIGTGKDLSIKDLVNKIKSIVGFEGKIEFQKDFPDGTPRKVLDISRIEKLGWKSKIPLEEGLIITYENYLDNIDTLRNK